MAASKCAKCGGNSFEAVTTNIDNYTYELRLIQCSKCGAVVGALPKFDAGVLARDILTEIEAIKKKLGP